MFQFIICIDFYFSGVCFGNLVLPVLLVACFGLKEALKTSIGLEKPKLLIVKMFVDPGFNVDCIVLSK